MCQFNAPVRRSGGNLDVYTGLLFAALCVLIAGIALLTLRNLDHSAKGNEPGGFLKLIER